MANRERGEVGFEAAARTWSLRYTTNRICAIEAETGRSIIALAHTLEDETQISVRLLRALFRGGLSQPVTDEEAGELIDALGLARAVELICAAFMAAVPQVDGGEENPPREGGPQRSTGAPSANGGSGSGGPTPNSGG
jgi:hypothetical protein